MAAQYGSLNETAFMSNFYEPTPIREMREARASTNLKLRKLDMKEEKKQAGAELWQAQQNLRLA